ncbi:MAG TPA: hypothetical protein VIM52_09825 [Stellaceae bacterium]
MADGSAYDRPFWDINSLVAALGKDEPAALIEIERAAGLGRLKITGRYGMFDDRFGSLGPREIIPELEFADKVIRKVKGQYALIPDPIKWLALSAWQDLLIRADQVDDICRDAEPAPVTAPNNPPTDDELTRLIDATFPIQMPGIPKAESILRPLIRKEFGGPATAKQLRDVLAREEFVKRRGKGRPPQQA